jgi:ElaA protein
VDVDLQDATSEDIDVTTFYRILALRSAVFVVEQECAYLDLDGRDVEPGARHLWAERGDEVLATLRVLHDADGTHRIGRVATAPAARGAGLAARLMQRALELAGDVDIVLEAQAHLYDWYARFGFARDGEDYLEDDILHTPMRRTLG